MKIAFFEIEKESRDYLQKNLSKHELLFFKDDLDENNINFVNDVDILCIFIYSKLDKGKISKFKNLKAVITMSTGFDHIDLKECVRKKIKVLNIPYYGENTVAEHTFALILDLSRRLHPSIEKTKRGNFSLDGLRGFDLKGKTIGIIGLGHIGEHVARIANGLEMKILVSTPEKNKKLERKYCLKYTSLKNLLKNSDIITLHCPLNKKTHHLINEKNINEIKEGAYIINTARGGLIKTKALAKALASKKLGGAALDVLEEEVLIKEEIQLLSKRFSKKNLENVIADHILLTFENVIITPHNAFNSIESLKRILDVTINNIICVASGKKCENVVGV